MVWIIRIVGECTFFHTYAGTRLVHAAVGDDELAMHGRYLLSCRVTEEDDYIFAPEGKAFSGRLWVSSVFLFRVS